MLENSRPVWLHQMDAGAEAWERPLRVVMGMDLVSMELGFQRACSLRKEFLL